MIYPRAIDRLLELWEGGMPHSVDLDSLEIIGTDNLEFNVLS